MPNLEVSASATDLVRRRRHRRFRIHRAHWAVKSGVWPGLFLVSLVTATAFMLREIPGVATLSPLIIAILLGMMFRNVVGTSARAKAGVHFSMRKLLRIGIILLGLQLTAAQAAAVGVSGIAIIAASLIATFLFTKWLGGMLGVDAKLSELIAAGTSICGASAVLATNTVTDAHDEDVAYAVACVTVFGSIAMFVYPLLPGFLNLSTRSYGLWAGASIHEIAQVVAASFQDGQSAGEFGTIAKLSRVMMLAPVVLALGFIAARRSPGEQSTRRKTIPLPWFVLGFVALVLLNSVIEMPAAVHAAAPLVTTVLLTMALAAMGLETDIRKLIAKGVRPALLGASASLFIALFSLALIMLAA